MSAVQTLSSPADFADDPELGVDRNGNAVFVWNRGFQIQGRARSAAGVLSPVYDLSPAGDLALEQDVAVAPDGNALFVWRRGASGPVGIAGRARSAAGMLSPIQPFSTASYSPEVAMDGSGNAVVSWTRDTEATQNCCFRVETRVRTAAGALGAVQALSPPGKNAMEHRLAGNPGGNAVFLWRFYDGPRVCAGYRCAHLQARTRSAAGGLSAIQDISETGRSANEPEVALAPSGRAVFVWGRTDYDIQARVRWATGTLSAIQTFSDVGSQPDVGIAQNGTAIAVWEDNFHDVLAATGP